MGGRKVEILNKISQKRVLVLGDTILDKTVKCQTIGLSLESPTLKTKEVGREIAFGGAANVVKNLLALGCECTFLTVLGNDEYLKYYEDWKSKSLRLRPLITKRQNVVKSRYWVERGNVSYKYLQINRGDKDKLKKNEFKKLYSIYEECIKNVDAIVLVDYNNGIFLDSQYIENLIIAAKKVGVPTVSSSQISDGCNRYPYFKNSTYICMNQAEASSNLRNFSPSDDTIIQLVSILNSNVCVTLGDKGSIFSDGVDIFREPPSKVNVMDPCGAGDSFLAAFSACLGDNNLKFCNKWASLATAKLGTTCPQVEDLNEPFC